MAYSKLGYMGLIKEATQGVALKPDTYIEILSESITSSKPIVPSAPVYGNDSKHLHANRGQAEGPAGDITVEVEPNTIGYLLSMFDDPATTGPTDTDAYTHTYSFPTSVTADTYTIDISIGDDFVRRYVGCVGTGISFDIADNVWTATISLQAEFEFVATSVDTTVSSGQTLNLAQTSGVTTSDTMILSPLVSAQTEETAVSAVDSETQLTVATITNTHTAAALATIKKSTPSFTQVSKFTWIGNTTYKEGALIGSVANVAMEQFSLNITRDVEVIHGTHSVANEERAYYPTDIKLKGFEASATLQKCWVDEEQIGVYQKGAQYAAEIESTNNDLVGAASQKGSLKIQIPDMRMTEDVGYNVGQDDIIQEARTLQVYNDATAAYQLKITLINAVTAY